MTLLHLSLSLFTTHWGVCYRLTSFYCDNRELICRLNIIIELEVWTFNHCLGWGYRRTMYSVRFRISLCEIFAPCFVSFCFVVGEVQVPSIINITSMVSTMEALLQSHKCSRSSKATVWEYRSSKYVNGNPNKKKGNQRMNIKLWCAICNNYRQISIMTTAKSHSFQCLDKTNTSSYACVFI